MSALPPHGAAGLETRRTFSIPPQTAARLVRAQQQVDDAAHSLEIARAFKMEIMQTVLECNGAGGCIPVDGDLTSEHPTLTVDVAPSAAAPE